MKEELCENVVEVGRVGDRVMTVVVVFEEDVLRLILGHAPQKKKFEEKRWDHNVAGDVVEGLVVCGNREEVLQALSEMKTGKALAL